MKQFLVSLLLSISVTVCVSQTNYFVSTIGNNGNSGSISNPWSTIQYGIEQLNPGDILNIRGGIYEEKININVSGTASQYITIQNYQDEEVVLDAINSTTEIAIIYTENAYLLIKGLHLTNNQQNYSMGLFVSNAAHHIEVINNKISNIDFSTNPNANVNTNTNSNPMAFLGNNPSDSIHDILVRGNEVYSNMTGFSENITMGGNVSGFIIEDNLVYDNTNIGIDMTGNYGECPNPIYDNTRNGIARNNLVYNCVSTYSSSAGIYVDGGKNIVVENNISHHNGYGGEIGCEENGICDNIIFRNNLFYLNAIAGMHIGGYDENTTGRVTNSKVLNNTFYKNDTENSYNGELIISQFENGSVMNNIFYISSQNIYFYAYRTQPNLVLDYNLIFTAGNQNEIETTVNENQWFTGLSELYTGTGFGEHSSYGDPLFISPESATPDFHISENSPAIDSGDPNYNSSQNEQDLDGDNRVYNSVIDCGVDEYSNGNVELNISALLEGPFSDDLQLMNDNLRQNGDIPLIEPFTLLGFIHVNGGNEVTTNEVLNFIGSDAIVDWIFIELRDGSNQETIVSTQSGLIQRDGDIVGVDGISPVSFSDIDVNSVVVLIRHRNHFGVRSASSYSTATVINIDFSNPNTSVFGFNSMIENNGKTFMIAGDANNDGTINPVDKNNFWRIQNGEVFDYNNSSADFNIDGVVNPVDKNIIWRANNSRIEQLD